MNPGDPATEHVWELERLIIDTLATSVTGLLAQTEMAIVYLGAEDPRGPEKTALDYRIMAALRAGLEHLAGRA